LSQRLLHPPRRLLQLLLQRIHLLADGLELLLGHHSRLGHLVRLAIRSPNRLPDSHCDARQPVLSHHSLPQTTAAILYPKELRRQATSFPSQRAIQPGIQSRNPSRCARELPPHLFFQLLCRRLSNPPASHFKIASHPSLPFVVFSKRL